MSEIKIISTSEELKSIREKIQSQLSKSNTFDSIGFVPTMGNLHRGHLSLLSHALKNHRYIFFSIFVNPKQFGPNEDYHKYPRTLDKDVQLIEEEIKKFGQQQQQQPLSQPQPQQQPTQPPTIFIFAPSLATEIFPQGYDTEVKVGEITKILCGCSRPTHFQGVTTVVYRLFALIRPAVAYFGLKDYQQYLVIKKMVEDLLLPIEVVGLPIVRDHDGLALSSRNIYLSPEERVEALVLPQTLTKIKNEILDGRKNNNTINLLLEKAAKIVKNDSRFEYLEILDGDTLSAASEESTKIIILGAFRVGNTRLIDNILI